MSQSNSDTSSAASISSSSSSSQSSSTSGNQVNLGAIYEKFKSALSGSPASAAAAGSLKCLEPIASLKAPLDSNGYFHSFSLSDSPAEIFSFYQQYGVVVFRDILSAADISSSIDDLWAEILQNPQVSRSDSSTWDNIKDVGFGFCGKTPLLGKQLWNNRQNPEIVKAFTILFEQVRKDNKSKGNKTEEINSTNKQTNSEAPIDLVTMVDRGSLMRPGGMKESWKSRRLYHFDLNPWYWTGTIPYPPLTAEEEAEEYSSWAWMLQEGNRTPNAGYPKLRGVLSFSDSNEINGGFECVLGFNRVIRAYSEEVPRPQIFLPRSAACHEALQPLMQFIPVRSGSMIIFTAELPHTPRPNLSPTEFRYAQYLRLQTKTDLNLDDETKKRKRWQLVKEYLPKDFEITQLGKEVLAIPDDEWTKYQNAKAQGKSFIQ